MTNLILADFHGLSIEVVDHAGKRWLTAEQAGRALGYAPDNARKGILKVYERNADEFTEADTCVVNLTTQTQDRATRVFSSTGCNLLGFFSNTPRSKAFRAWAKEALTGQAAVLPAPTSARYPALPGRGALITRAVERRVLERFVEGQKQKVIARELGLSPATVNLLIHAKYQFALGVGASECSQELIAAVAARHLLIEQDKLIEAQNRIAQKLLASSNNAPLAAALDQVGRALLPEGGAA